MAKTAPTVHLNGTSGEDLFKQYAGAAAAVRQALDAVSQASPHGRDYYTQQKKDAYIEARYEHEVRLTKLQDILEELEDLAQEVRDQIDARGGR